MGFVLWQGASAAAIEVITNKRATQPQRERRASGVVYPANLAVKALS